MITVTERRRHRSPEEKAAIVGESMVPGSVIAEVARRHGVSAQQLYGWRSTLKARASELGASEFAPAIVEDRVDLDHRKGHCTRHCEALIEVTFGQASVVVRGAVDQRALATVLKALKGLM